MRKIDPRCWREMAVRGGAMAIVAAVADFILGADHWVWLVPVGISAMVLLKWIKPAGDDGQDQPT